jgi:hypothetical protein
VSIDHGLVVGVLVGVVAVAGVAVTYVVVHNRGIVSGCISESGGTLVASDNTVYSLPDTGSSLPVGKRVKLKGHKLGPASSRSFQVEKVLKVYGPCQHEPPELQMSRFQFMVDRPSCMKLGFGRFVGRADSMTRNVSDSAGPTRSVRPRRYAFRLCSVADDARPRLDHRSRGTLKKADRGWSRQTDLRTFPAAVIASGGAPTGSPTASSSATRNSGSEGQPASHPV